MLEALSAPTSFGLGTLHSYRVYRGTEGVAPQDYISGGCLIPEGGHRANRAYTVTERSAFKRSERSCNDPGFTRT
jgi:hypothetical protein